MKIKHEFNHKYIEGDSENPGFMITNRNGSYYSYSTDPSRYDGFFINEKNDMYKILDYLFVNKPVSKIINNFSHITLDRGHVIEKCYMIKNLNSLICNFNKHMIIELFLDIKKSYDNRNYGRFYKISHENNKIIIQFDKITNRGDNEQEGIHEYTMYVVINESTFTKPNIWTKRSYGLDKSRNSEPSERYVYQGLKVITNNLIITASLDKKKAINENNYILKNLNEILAKNEKYTLSLLSRFKHSNKKLDFAYKCSINSLDQLTTEKGVLAGLPWFFQYWARDELISSKAISLFNKHLAKQIIDKYIDFYIKNNNLYSNQESKLISKDALGLLILRATETQSYDNKIIKHLRSINPQKSLIENGNLETWMDTYVANDTRAGARIEIQCYYLKIYSLMYKVTRDKKFKFAEEKLCEETRKKFFTGTLLKDGSDDSTIRPNIFLAYYIYPNLLTKEEWNHVFETSIPKIWNNWGGFSSIEKSSPLFQMNYTGEDNISYHRGDSWYFLNNIAAICLLRQNKNKYSKYINKIIESSTNEILWSGYIGFESELSSSSRQKSEGCKAQAWSSAIFIELLKEIKS